MRILCVGTDRHAAGAATDRLRAVGHQVVGCYRDPAGPAFPCRGLERSDTCPLDDPDGLDAVLTVRRRPHPHPMPRERGVACALRRGIPLVVAGNPSLNPFEWWTQVTVAGDDVATACEKAATAALEDTANALAAELRRLLDGQIPGDRDVSVEIERYGSRLIVTIHRPKTVAHLDGVLAVHAHRTLRDAGITTPHISISAPHHHRYPTPTSTQE